MKFEDRVGDYLENGPYSGADHVPDGAVQVRRLLGSDMVFRDPPPSALAGVLDRIRAERAAGVEPPVGPVEPAAPIDPAVPVSPVVGGPIDPVGHGSVGHGSVGHGSVGHGSVNGVVAAPVPLRAVRPADPPQNPGTGENVVPLHRRTGSRRAAAAAVAAVVFGIGGTVGWLAATSGTGVEGSNTARPSAEQPGQDAPGADVPNAAQPGAAVPGGEEKRVDLAGTELAPEATAVVRVRNRPSGTALSLDSTKLPPAGGGQYYEAWVKPAEGHAVPIGTFHMRSEETVELWAGVDVRKYRTITVTVQREAGGPESSGKVVLRGEIPG
jgi:hypothetical protein